MTNVDIYKRRILSLILMSTAPIIAIAPFLIGLVGSKLTPGCTNEANCGWGVLPWFMFLTIPAGAALVIAGFVRFLVAMRKKLSKGEPVTVQEKKLKRYQFAWMATASGPLLGVLVLALSLYAGPVEVCNGDLACTQTANGAFVSALGFIAPALVVASWLYLVAVVIWNKLTKE